MTYPRIPRRGGAYIPKGCDQQGRHPQAAEPCTEIGDQHDDNRHDTDNLAAARGIVLAVGVTCAAIAAAALIAGWHA